MNILVIHNAYQQRGGEDVMVEAEVAMLERAGHRVRLELISNHGIRSPLDKLETFLNAPFDHRRTEWIAGLLKSGDVELVHVHNFFPLVTPAVHAAAASHGVAVVQTLHNYRTICAGALLLRDGVPCEKCIEGSPLWGVVHRCYRGSFVGSVAVTRMQRRVVQGRPWHSHVHRLIALTKFGRGKFIEGGLDPHRLVVKPNFLPGVSERPSTARRWGGALYVGRLSHEKGVHTLIEAWRDMPNVPLTIVGDGPERARMADGAPPWVRFLGQVSPVEVRKLMREAIALIVPSVCYEGFPAVVIEAYAAGLPVVGSRLGSLAEVVEDNVTGLHFMPGSAEDLRSQTRCLFADTALAESLGAQARLRYEQRYTEAANLALLEAIYHEAMQEAKAERFSSPP